MNETEVIERIRQGIREPRAVITGPTGITRSITDAINLLGMILIKAQPEYFIKRTSLSSDSTAFTIPSDNISVIRVWDMDTNAATVTATASEGGLIKMTYSAAHGWSTGDIITQHDVGGTTEANGTFRATVLTTTTLTLDGTTHSNAWTSGGKAFREYTDFEVIDRAPLKEAYWDDETKYYLKNNTIVVDDHEFTNDIIIDYREIPTTLAEIPDRFHFGIVAFGVIDQIRLPETNEPRYSDMNASLQKNMVLWQTAQTAAANFAPISESKNTSDVVRIKRWI